MLFEAEVFTVMTSKVDDIFEQLYEEPVNSPDYCLLQGELYDFLESDCRSSVKDAMQAARHLNNGKVEEAEEFVYEVLEDE